MLNFPLWKVGIIVVVLLWGTVLALPNMFSDGFLGIDPKEPSDPTNTEAVAAYEQQLQEAERTASEPAAPVLPSSQPHQPAVPFAETTGQLKLPVRGAVLTRFGETDRFGADSKGMTLATRPGARVSTPIDGKVVYAGPFRSFGSVVILDVGGGYHILLAGMEQVDISLGQEILLGEPIGAMGSRRFASISSQGTGLSQPLLYIEFWHNDKPIDSSPWWTTSISKGG